MRAALGRRTRRGIALAVVLLLAVLAIMFWPRSPDTAQASRIGIISSLPMRWSDAGVAASLRDSAEALPAWTWLDRRYRVAAIDRIDAAALKVVDVTLLIQPRRLAPAEIAALDAWVRDGGRAIIFADPALAWQSDLPPGDVRRPLYTSLLSPLFAHWGVDLTLPMDRAERLQTVEVGGRSLTADVAGAWVARDGARDCRIEADALLARCAIGKGQALLVADADLLDARLWSASGWAPWSERDSAMVWLGGEIDRMRPAPR